MKVSGNVVTSLSNLYGNGMCRLSLKSTHIQVETLSHTVTNLVRHVDAGSVNADFDYLSTVNSTRRLRWRPSVVSFEASGRFSP